MFLKMNKFFTAKAFKLFLIFLPALLSQTSVSAQTPSVAQIEEPKTPTEFILFFALLLFVLLAPAFKKREWPRLRKGYDYFMD